MTVVTHLEISVEEVSVFSDQAKMVESEMIDPQFQVLYPYQIKQSDDDIDVMIDFPETFNPEAIKVDLNKELNAIKVTVKDLIPIVCGELFGKVESCTTNTDIRSGKFTITFEKKTPGTWPILISNYYPGTNDIDPEAALILSQNVIKDGQNDPAMQEFAQKLFSYSIDSGFVPAIFAALEINGATSNDPQVAVQLLSVASLKYHHPIATFHLGMILSQDKNSVIDGFNLLVQASKMGVGIAASFVGKLLSPLSEDGFPGKDAKEAIQIFERVISHAEEPIALYEAARLYDAGVGCDRNHEKALQYWNRAKKANPETPELPPPPAEKSAVVKIGIVAGVAAAAAGFAYLAYRSMRKLQ